MGNDTRHALALSNMPAGYYYYFLKASVQASWSIPLNAHETPWQRFTGKPAPARYLRVPGCLAFYKVVHPPDKMSMRARRAIHLGRAWDQPAYILSCVSLATYIAMLLSMSPAQPPARG